MALGAALLDDGISGLPPASQPTDFDRHLALLKRDLRKGADITAGIFIAVAWAYLIPYAAYPKSGCPADPDRRCWQYCFVLAFYIVGATAIFPLVSVAITRYCSHRIRELTRQGSKIRRRSYFRGQELFVAALGTCWSVSNSTFIYNVVSQAALTGGFNQPANGGGGGGGGGGDSRPPPDDQQPHRSLLSNNGPGFAQHQDDRSGNLFGVFVACVLAVGYLALSVLNIFCVTALCKLTPRCRSGQASFVGDYFTELGLLCQNNWYYAVGYSAYLFLTYLWFGSLTTSNLGAWHTLGLDSLRFVVLSGMATTLAFYVLPFDPAKDAAPLSGEIRARLRLLLFRAQAVVVSVSFAAFNTDFACTFLPDVAGVSEGGQIGVLTATALVGLLTLTRADSVLEAVDPPTAKSLFLREAAQWTLAFLVWLPWQLCVVGVTALVRKDIGRIGEEDSDAAVFFALLFFGVFVTVSVAFFNGLVHEHSTVVTRFGRHFDRAGTAKRSRRLDDAEVNSEAIKKSPVHFESSGEDCDDDKEEEEEEEEEEDDGGCIQTHSVGL